MRIVPLMVIALVGYPVFAGPIHDAAQKGDVARVKALLKTKGARDSLDENGMTPLMVAAVSGRKDVISLLLQKGAPINGNGGPIGSPLHLATYCSFEIVDFLLKKGADINAVNARGQTPLISAIEAGVKEPALHLIQRGASVNPIKPGAPYPLDLAYRGLGLRDVVEELVLRGATSSQGVPSKLDVYVRRNDMENARKLIAAGADVNAKGLFGNSIISSAWSVEMLELLVSHGADVNAKGLYGETPIFTTREAKVLEFLVSHGADVNVRTEDGRTPLHCHASWPDRVQYLLDHGAKPDAANSAGRTPLADVCQRGTGRSEPILRAAELLLAHGADPNSIDSEGDTPLLRAVLKRDLPLVQTLIAHGADVNGVGPTSLERPIHTAVRIPSGDEKQAREDAVSIVRLLLGDGADVNARDAQGNTPLFYAVGSSRPEYVRMLLEKGADVRATDKDGQTLLQAAVTQGNQAVIDLLLQRGLDINAASKDGKTPIWSVVKRGSMDLYRRLIAKGANPRAKTATGRTLLFEAARYDRADIAADLIQRGLDVNAANAAGVTALHLAAHPESGSTKTLSLLLAHGAKPNARMKDGRTPIDLAGSMDAIKLLRKAGAKTRGGWLVVGDDPFPLPE